MLLDRPALLGAERELVQPRDLALALAPGGVVRREAGDQRPDPVAELKREVRRRGAHQLAHVLDGRLAAAAVWALVLAQESARLPRALPARGAVARRARRPRPHSLVIGTYMPRSLHAGYGAFGCTGTSSVSWSTWACCGTEIALSSPMIQARL